MTSLESCFNPEKRKNKGGYFTLVLCIQKGCNEMKKTLLLAKRADKRVCPSFTPPLAPEMACSENKALCGAGGWDQRAAQDEAPPQEGARPDVHIGHCKACDEGAPQVLRISRLPEAVLNKQ